MAVTSAQTLPPKEPGPVWEQIEDISLLSSCRLIPDIAGEPIQILLHCGAVGLRLRQAVAEAFEDRQLHGHVLIAKSLIQLERIRNRHPRVVLAVLDQR